jgi:A/G-specific adenine glycosylase
VLSPAGKKEFTALAKELLPPQRAGQFNQAIMELGETVCLPNGTPRCECCPMQEICEAKKQGRTTELPVRLKNTVRQIEKRTVFLVHTDTHILLHKRPDAGLLAGLYEFPSCSGEMTKQEAQQYLSDSGISAENIVEISPAKHVFTHKEWHMSGFAVLVSKKRKLPGEYVWVTKRQLYEQYAVPSAFRHFLNYIAKNL